MIAPFVLQPVEGYIVRNQHGWLRGLCANSALVELALHAQSMVEDVLKIRSFPDIKLLLVVRVFNPVGEAFLPLFCNCARSELEEGVRLM